MSYHLKTEVRGDELTYRKKVNGEQVIKLTENFKEEIMALQESKVQDARKMLGI